MKRIISMVLALACLVMPAGVSLANADAPQDNVMKLQPRIDNYPYETMIYANYGITYATDGTDPYHPTGWRLFDGEWRYFDNGTSIRSWLYDDGKWYFLGPEMLTGWNAVSYNLNPFLGWEFYYFNESGVMQTGWLYDNGNWYYLKPSGAMVANDWFKVGDTWYWFSVTGRMATGNTKINGKSYRFGSDGAWLG